MTVGLSKLPSSAAAPRLGEQPTSDARPRREAARPPALRGAEHHPTTGGALESAPAPSAGRGPRFGHALRSARNLAAAGAMIGVLAGCATLPPAPAPEPFVIDVDVEVRDGEIARVETRTRGEDPWSAQLRTGFSEIARQSFFGAQSVAFAHYAGDDGRWGAGELGAMLARLDIGTPALREDLVGLLLDRHDGDGDRRLTFSEFQGVMQR